jgi:tripartite ATP-independent transporter DctP family solute receptor
MLQEEGYATHLRDEYDQGDKMKNPEITQLLALALLALTLWALPRAALAQSAPRDIRIAIGVDEKHPKGLAVLKFAELLKESSGGKLTATLHANGKLGGDAKTITEMQRGTLEMAVPDTATLVSQIKGFGIINFPFLFSSEADADVLLDGQFGQKLNASLEKIGLVGLGFWENGFRNVTNDVRDITRLDDFRGLRIRVIENPMYIETFKALGAMPVPLPFPEVYANLQDKKIDGQENPLVTIQSSKFYKVQKYLTLTRHTYSVWIFLMSKQMWDKLSREEQALIKSAAAETLRYERSMMRSNSAAIVEDLRKAGMTIHEPSSVQRSDLRRITRPIIDKYKKEFGEEWTLALYLGMVDNELTKFKAPEKR